MSRCIVVVIENAELTPTEEVRSQLLVSAQWSLENHWIEVFWVSEDRITPVSDCALSDAAIAATK